MRQGMVTPGWRGLRMLAWFAVLCLGSAGCSRVGTILNESGLAAIAAPACWTCEPASSATQPARLTSAEASLGCEPCAASASDVALVSHEDANATAPAPAGPPLPPPVGGAAELLPVPADSGLAATLLLRDVIQSV